jgi:hypothetical protein
MQKVIAVVVLLLVGATARAQAPGSPGAARPAASRIRLAVLDVQYAGAGDSKTVEGLSALIASEVARRPGLTVLAGADVRALLGFERQKALLGCTEGSCMAELAGALGVSFLISSEISRVGSTWLLSLSLLDANRAAAMSRLTRKAYSDDQLVEEAADAVDELMTALPGAGAPRPRTGKAARSEPSPVAPAEPQGPPPGYHRHDGAMFRLQLGYGSASSAGGDLKLSGGSMGLALGAGFALVDNLLLYGEFFTEMATGPKLTQGGVAIDRTTGTKTNNLSGLGAGLAWYFEGLNAYVSASGGAAVLTYMMPNGAGTSNERTSPGPALRLGVGKEWWVSTNWGLGLAVTFETASMKATLPGPATFRCNAFGAGLSATWN